MSIFSMSEELAEEDHPPIPDCPEWTTIERCRAEKEVISTYLSGHPLDDFKYEMKMFTTIGVVQLAALDQLAGREVHFGGMVSGVKGGVSAKGNPYGSMVIDDYSGSYELKLYGDDYISHSGHFENDTFVFCRGQVYKRDYVDKKTGANRTFTKLHITAMMSLASVLDRYTNTLTLNVALKDVNEAFCRDLERVALEHQGKIPLQVNVIEPIRNLSLTFRSGKYKVAVHDILPALEQIKGVFNIKPTIKG
jgi:DNA polymerase-3 subunit alpha